MGTTPRSDSWEHGQAYEQYIGRWSRLVAPPFVSWLNIPAGQRWLDIGCGTGALSAAILDHCSPALVAGIEPSEGFLKVASQNLAGRVVLHQGSAASIPLADATIDVVVSGLVFNFIPDQPAALAEMARVASNNGTIAAYVWDYAEKMELIRLFWDAAITLTPAARALDEAQRFPICRPEALIAQFRRAGLHKPEVLAIEVPTPFASFDAYWQPFLGGQGPAPAFVMSLDEPARQQLRAQLRPHLPIQADGSIALTARAWAIRATVLK